MAATDATAIPVKNQAYRLTFPIFDADGDLVTGATGLDSEVSKDAGAFADCTSEATEIAASSGMYYLDLTSTEMNADTVAVIVKTSSSGAKTTPIVLYPAEAADIIVNVKKVNGTDQTAGDLAAMVTAVDDFLDTEIAAIKAKTDNLPADPADASDIAASFTTVNGKLDAIDDYVDSEVAAIKAKTDNLPAAPAATGDIPSAATIAAAVWDRLTSALTTVGSIGKLLVDNVNQTISSRASQSSLNSLDDYVDSEVADIKAKTDLIPSDPADASDVAAAFAAVNSKLDAIDDYVDSEVAAIKAKTDLIPASPAATGDIPSASSVADALLDRTDGVEAGWTPRQALRVILAALAGKLSGAGTGSVAIRDVGDTKDRIAATVDADGNRSAVTHDKS